jgi:peptide deformylase
MIYELEDDLSRLRLYGETFDFSNPQTDPVVLANDMVETMYHYNGLGLAHAQMKTGAPPLSVFAMRGSPENFVVFNPHIIHASDILVSLEEGCLSYPGLIVKIKRPQFIRARFNTPNGDTMTKGFYGLAARVFQHEMCHLDGEIFYSSANRYHREQALKKWKNKRPEDNKNVYTDA